MFLSKAFIHVGRYIEGNDYGWLCHNSTEDSVDRMPFLVPVEKEPYRDF